MAQAKKAREQRPAERASMDAATASLEKQIAELKDCKPLTESEVEALCQKVRLRCRCCWSLRTAPHRPARAVPRRRARCCSPSPTC